MSAYIPQVKAWGLGGKSDNITYYDNLENYADYARH